MPLASRFAVTVGVAVGLFASIIVSGSHPELSTALLWIGVGAGIAVAVYLWIRAPRPMASVDPSQTLAPRDQDDSRPRHTQMGKEPKPPV